MSGFATRKEADDFAESVASVEGAIPGLANFNTRKEAIAHAARAAERRTAMKPEPNLTRALQKLLATADKDPVGAHVVTRKPTTLKIITAAGEGPDTASDDAEFDPEVVKHALYPVAPYVRQLIKQLTLGRRGTLSALKLISLTDGTVMLYVLVSVPPGDILPLPGVASLQTSRLVTRIAARVQKMPDLKRAHVDLFVRPVNANRLMLGISVGE